MDKKFLFTSFTTWKPEQVSNASDDLLFLMKSWFIQSQFSEAVHLLRKLPVDFELAPQKVITHVEQIQPDLVVCCGMAEKRDRLNLEAQATCADQTLTTSLDLITLVEGLSFTDISYDAGKFVCNHTYFSLLNYLQNHQKTIHGLFIHVPVLTEANQDAVLRDFQAIAHRLSQNPSIAKTPGFNTNSNG